jgi:acetylornithine deacetylase/succinyl-diaminopimelate desuccinylase-like protein
MQRRISVWTVAFVTVCTAIAVVGHAQDAVRATRQWRAAHERELLDTYMAMLRLPNVARDLPNVKQSADWLLAEMGKRGLNPKLLTVADAAPVVYGELRTPGAAHTYVFYAHYDGQAVNPVEWSNPPFEPTLTTGRLDQGATNATLPTSGSVNPDWRIYARSAADDRAAIFGMLSAIDSLKAAGIRSNANLKFFFEGEEEALSPHLEAFLAGNKGLLQGDLWLVCDGPEHASGLQTLTFGSRGAVSIDITVYGPNHELHSGHYGNWAPNPAMMLAQLLTSMKDADGKVLVEGFYDGVIPLSAAEQQAIREIPNVDLELQRQFGLARVEGGGKRLEELINLPSLNIRGISSGKVGANANNVVPAAATASVDLRLVPGLSTKQQADRLIAHIQKQGYFVTAVEPEAAVRIAHGKIARVVVGPGYEGVRTPMDLAEVQPVVRAMESVRRPVVLQPTLGGSTPQDVIQRALGTRTIVIPLANFDNNQHTFNENIRIGHLWNAIDSFAALFIMN